MKTTAYLRVSTLHQDHEKNKSDILQLSNDKLLGNVKFIEEQVSGKISWRKRKIYEIIETLERGDNLIVSELSRLGRNMLEVMEILSVCSEKGINVYAIKGNWALDNTIQSKIIAMAFSIASEIERDLISMRTKESLATRKANGIKLGRPRGYSKSKLDEFKPEILALLSNGSSKKFIAKRYNTAPSNLHKWLKKVKTEM